ncbi:MAG: DUF4352 domain-containing protein [Nitrososphaerales archaeon]
MMRFVRIGIFFALFMAIGIASSMFQQNNEEDTTEIESNRGPENRVPRPVIEQSTIGEPLMVSGLSYQVTNARVSDSLPAAGLWEQPEEEYMLISMYVENLSKEPKSELKMSDFILTDSEDRRFIAIKPLSLIFGESWDTLQPGLGGYRGLVFQIPFDSELEYNLVVGDNKIVQLGMGKI